MANDTLIAATIVWFLAVLYLYWQVARTNYNVPDHAERLMHGQTEWFDSLPDDEYMKEITK